MDDNQLFGFDDVIKKLKQGLKLTRRGWYGSVWICLQNPDSHSKMTLPYIYMKNAHGNQVPWVASHSDILADDWEVAE